LAAELARRHLPANAVILALPRGVPIGFQIAQLLKLPLDVVSVRKLGVPWQPELAIGAIAGDTRTVDRPAVRSLGISEEQLAAITQREIQEMARREELYRRNLPPPDLQGRPAVLVDDGLATGSTMLAALRHVRRMGPERVLVAVPVGSREACMQLEAEADHCVCLASPEPFIAVGRWYEDFRAVTDAEVHDLLLRSQNASSSPASD
jgi:predicted phosphoribosyltransferase